MIDAYKIHDVKNNDLLRVLDDARTNEMTDKSGSCNDEQRRRSHQRRSRSKNGSCCDMLRAAVTSELRSVSVTRADRSDSFGIEPAV